MYRALPNGPCSSVLVYWRSNQPVRSAHLVNDSDPRPTGYSQLSVPCVAKGIHKLLLYQQNQKNTVLERIKRGCLCESWKKQQIFAPLCEI